MSEISIAFVEDHQLVRAALSQMINEFGPYKVTLQANDGHHLIQQLSTTSLPQLVLLDIEMRGLNGYETAMWLQAHHPEIKVVAISGIYLEFSVTKMLKAGCCAFVAKDAKPDFLRQTLDSVVAQGFYFGGELGPLVQQVLQPTRYGIPRIDTALSKTEINFLQLCGTALTYQQIAAELKMTVKQAEHLRNKLCVQLELQTRPQLAVFAHQNGFRLRNMSYAKAG